MLKQALCSVAVTERVYYGAICVYIYKAKDYLYISAMIEAPKKVSYVFI